jgi:hypothetical protein
MNQAEKITTKFCNLLQKELRSDCPEESMSTMLDEQWWISSAEMKDGNLQLSLHDGENKRRILTLKPVAWERGR